jgi:TolB-like protein/DNA-binding winged helix-turn-helix (wHTH) protein/tetratricopeptide (TPR) repeat protein
MPGPILRFNDTEIDVARYELRRNSSLLRLERLPMELLVLLASRQGELVTREEVIERLWGKDVYLDTEQGINTAIRKIRICLRDTAENPKYIQTVVGRGYRFVPPVTLAANEGVAGPATRHPPIATSPRSWRRIQIATLAALVCVAAAGIYWRSTTRRSVASSSSDKIMLAVLPFVNLSADPQQDYFSDGLTEEIITRLGSFNPSRLAVIARTSTIQYKGAKKSVAEIGQELGVDYVLEGSTRSDGTRVRIAAQLIQVHDQTHIWADSYDAEMRDVLDVHRNIASAVASSISVALPEAGRGQSAARSVNPQAYEDYLRAKFLFEQRTEESLIAALQHFHKSAELDPSFAGTYAGIADCYALLEYYGYMSPKEAYPQALAAVMKALQLDRQSAEAHLALGYIRNHYEWNWREGESEVKAAITINPSSSLAHRWYSYFLFETGRVNEAIDEDMRAVQFDPVNVSTMLSLAWRLQRVGRYEEAVRQAKSAAEIAPASPLPHLTLAQNYEAVGDVGRAAAEFERALVLRNDPRLLQVFRRNLPQSGFRQAKLVTEREDNLAQITRLQERERSGKYVSPAAYAERYARLGNKDDAYRRLLEAFRDRSSLMIELGFRNDFDFMRSDPRFKDLVRRVGVPQIR